jgi:hypothetical protein
MLNPVQKAIVNDIDLDRLTKLVAESAITPALGFEVTTRWDGQFRSESSVGPIKFGNGDTVIRDFVIKADEPEEILGSNQSPNPQELLMAALNACMTVGYVPARPSAASTSPARSRPGHARPALRAVGRGAARLSSLNMVRIADDATRSSSPRSTPSAGDLAQPTTSPGDRMEARLEVA